jgi:hypothetical protein
MIFDCTTVFNEFELLFMRSGELKGPVDKWFVAEGNYDFSGNKREWRLALYKPPGHKIIRVDLSFLQRLPPQQRARASEIYQRNQLIEAVLAIAGDNDTIWISDVDDIPKPEIIESILAAIARRCPKLKLHGFGLKITALEYSTIRGLLFSSDSMAWSFSARMQNRDNHDWKEAKAFADRIASMPLRPSQSRLSF